jgi:diketogulonate reductase-like aldo/keto reductase
MWFCFCFFSDSFLYWLALVGFLIFFFFFVHFLEFESFFFSFFFFVRRTWRVKDDTVQRAVVAAFRSGYKHIDTAAIYENEAAIGRVFQEAFGKPSGAHESAAHEAEVEGHAVEAAKDIDVENAEQNGKVAANDDDEQKKTSDDDDVDDELEEADSSGDEDEPAVDWGVSLAEDLKVPKMERSEVFVTSKLWNTHHSAEHVEAACLRSLADLKLDYLDLYLVHWPVAFAYSAEPGYPSSGKNMPVPLTETWHAMQALVDKGLVRHIGVSNFGIAQLAELLRHPGTTIRPAVNQIELHPYLSQRKLVQYCAKKNIAVEGYSPLGSSARPGWSPEPDRPSLLTDQIVVDIAKRHDVSPASVLIRWQLQQNFVVLPRSSKPTRILQNIEQPNSFELSASDMDELKKLNRPHRFVDPDWYSFSSE